MEVKDILKNRRIQLKLTMSDIADYVGVNKATVSRWESGEIDNMRRDKIKKLSEILQITPAVIMGMEEPEDSYYLNSDAAKLAQELANRPEMRVLFDASRKATKEDIEQVASILEKLGDK